MGGEGEVALFWSGLRKTCQGKEMGRGESREGGILKKQEQGQALTSCIR